MGALAETSLRERVLPGLWEVRTHLLEYGPENGEPVVFVHGYQSDARIWSRNLAGLGPDFHTIAVDLPGHGKSGKPLTTYTIPFYSRFLGDLLGRLNLGPVTLVGLSLGGAIAAATAIAWPSRVKRLVVVDGLGMGAAHPRQLVHLVKRFFPLVWAQVTGRIGRQDIYRFLSEVLFADSHRIDEELVSLAVEGSRQSRLASLLTGLMLVLPSSHLYPRLHLVQQPTLLIWGDSDHLFPVDHARQAAARIPHCQLVVIPKAGHLPHLEQPAIFHEELVRFLRSTPADSD